MRGNRFSWPRPKADHTQPHSGQSEQITGKTNNRISVVVVVVVVVVAANVIPSICRRFYSSGIHLRKVDATIYLFGFICSVIRGKVRVAME
jgi:hypothetical protein